MRITTLSRVAGTTLVAGILLIVGSGWLAFQELRVNGHLYQRIASGKDLIADVVPPSAYLIEAFLEATIISKEPWTLEPGRKRLKGTSRGLREPARVLEPAGSGTRTAGTAFQGGA